MMIAPLQAAFLSNRTQLDGTVTCSPLGHALIGPSGSLNNDTWSDPAACIRGSITLSQQDSEWLILMASTFTAALVLFIIGVGLCCFRRSLRAFVLSQCGIRVCTGGGNAGDDEDKLFDALVIYSAKDDLLLKETLNKLEEKTYQLCLQHRTDDHDLNAAASASHRILVLLTKSFIETEWGKVHIRTVLRSTWTQPSSQRDKLVVLVPERIAEMDADLDLHLLMKHANVIEWNGRFRWSRLLLALPPARGLLAPADCSTATSTTHMMLQTTPLHVQQSHQPFIGRHHHKLIHQSHRQLPTLPETLPETI